ncbi:MAG: hypothetical protein DWI29_05715 [Planctomycetota bacterium]|nr:MAG: hypothetical protein DWI29_05715 [Planctomycetota bacterium]
MSFLITTDRGSPSNPACTSRIRREGYQPTNLRFKPTRRTSSVALKFPHFATSESTHLEKSGSGGILSPGFVLAVLVKACEYEEARDDFVSWLC